MKGVAGVFQIQTKLCRVKLLFDKELAPVDAMYRGPFKDVMLWIKNSFPEFTIISSTEFNIELDHIKLFGCRSDDLAYVLPIEEQIKAYTELDTRNMAKDCEIASQQLKGNFEKLFDSLSNYSEDEKPKT